jgi:hypothetical protein
MDMGGLQTKIPTPYRLLAAMPVAIILKAVKIFLNEKPSTNLRN